MSLIKNYYPTAREKLIMSLIKNYYPTARENEEVFRNVLRDLKNNRSKRPMGERYIPKDLETEIELDKIFQRYSQGDGRFTITNFTRPNKTKATIEFQDIDILLGGLSGGGAELEYLVKENNSVKYKKPLFTMRS